MNDLMSIFNQQSAPLVMPDLIRVERQLLQVQYLQFHAIARDSERKSPLTRGGNE